MAKKSSFKRLGKSVASRKRRARKNPGGSKTKSWLADLGLDEAYTLVLPGLAGYTGARVAGRIGYQIARRKSVGLAKHVGPWTSVAVALATFWATGKFTQLKPYREGAVIGASIAAVQGLLQTYVPQWSWILNDYHLNDALPQAPAANKGATPEPKVRYISPGEIPGHGPADAGGGDVDIDGDDDYADIPGMGGSFKSGIFA